MKKAPTVSATTVSEQAKRLQRLATFARLMDANYRIPGTSIRFGWDSLIGFIPGVGDVATAVVSGWMLREAYLAGATKTLLVKMAGNIAIDLASGSIPIAGDLFDVYWKSNVRNVQLLQKHLESKS